MFIFRRPMNRDTPPVEPVGVIEPTLKEKGSAAGVSTAVRPEVYFWIQGDWYSEGEFNGGRKNGSAVN
ncbi:hypothetical protein EYZ11_007597 [Aspergillus tanneri]|uniref:Uncharacterized protein n=1 Tax=Aspergillus tanneri TaxID=1220188 RepID=A0A4S3JEU6_9EURO|nr:hypothetical protein EYZ11_007597 [Aspergillus tanneri]